MADAAARREEFLQNFHFWRRYRNPTYVDLSDDQVSAAYRTLSLQTNYSEGDPVAARPLHPQPPIAPAQLTQAQEDFLNKAIPDLPGNAQYWKGMKFLGEGGNALVGLREYDGPV
jgi:hypothetical protein